MLNIAIVDDDKKFIAIYRQVIANLFSEHHVVIDIREYFSGTDFINSLSTGGFKIQSEDKNKGKFSFEFTGHYSMAEISKVPFEVYIKAGTAEG